MDKNAKFLLRMAQIGAISSVYHLKKNNDQYNLSAYLNKIVPSTII